MTVIVMAILLTQNQLGHLPKNHDGYTPARTLAIIDGQVGYTYIVYTSVGASRNIWSLSSSKLRV